MDKRAIFFFGAAVVCGALTFALDELQWVPLTLSALYLLFAALSWLDYRSRDRR